VSIRVGLRHMGRILGKLKVWLTGLLEEAGLGPLAGMNMEAGILVYATRPEWLIEAGVLELNITKTEVGILIEAD